MLHEFLDANRSELIESCRAKVALRAPAAAVPLHLQHGIPTFLEQLIGRLRDGAAGGGNERGRQTSEIAASAALHGRELSKLGFTVEQVVHAYGDLCQAITELAQTRNQTIEVEEFRTLNGCLDNGIADAVTEFSLQRGALLQSAAVHAMNERLGILAHELRNQLHTATLAIGAVKAGHVGLNGATGAVLDRCLIGMRSLIDRSLADVRMEAGLAPQSQIISLADFIADVRLSAALEAGAHGCQLVVEAVDTLLAVDVDREMLFSAVGNLLQNAFKFTRHGTQVALLAYGAKDRVRIEVADHCGGLKEVCPEDLFLPFRQTAGDRSGLGLGLAISRRSVEANHGSLGVRDVPGTGCVFTIDLPRHAA